MTRTVAAPLLIAVGCAALVPLSPALPGTTLDEGWMFGLNAAVTAGLRFGSEVVFTFGPYAAAYTHLYHPATDGLMLGATVLHAAAVAAGLVVLTMDRHRWPAVLFACALSQVAASRDVAFAIVPLLFLAVAAAVAESDEAPRPAAVGGLVLLALMLAVMPLVKGSMIAWAGVGIGLGPALLAWCRKWWLAALLVAVFPVGTAAAWLASGQALADLPGFFAAQVLVIAGYTDAMAMRGPAAEAVVFAACAALVLILHGRAQSGRGAPGRVLLLGAAALLFLVFKAGFVRQDAPHVLQVAGALGLFAWIMLLGRPGARPVLALAVGLVGWTLLCRMNEPFSPGVVLDRAVRTAEAAAAGSLERLGGGDALRQRYEGRLAEIRAQHPLPPTAGTVDTYSVGQSILLAHGVPWMPRPTFQSYAAYSGLLARANADHLTGSRAPDTILFAPEPIDGRLASQEDGASWPILLTRYEAVGLQGGLAVLRRRTGPVVRPTLGAPVLAGTFRFGDTVRLPEDRGPLWATIRVRPTPLGRLVSALLRPSRPAMAFRMADGATELRRFLPGAGEAGFLVAPIVDTAEQFLALGTPGSQVSLNRMPTSFVLDAAGWGGHAWDGSFAVEVRPLLIPPQPALRDVLLTDPAHG